MRGYRLSAPIGLSLGLLLLLAGCAQPNPNTMAGQSDIAGQKCAVCMATNPRDYWACHAICVRRVEDEDAYVKAIGR
jgi:hypothetical protein